MGQQMESNFLFFKSHILTCLTYPLAIFMTCFFFLFSPIFDDSEMSDGVAAVFGTFIFFVLLITKYMVGGGG